ncbi:OTU domain-containing protein 5-B [Parasteatoda tepidariorum]|uniref:OTU domain-containing protein 5-B n=1 Tax=Parasteatoda tepidariorum TaxID=114398 RepID=UPI00077FE132|nr:OTU domain-containing protein 5-B [Parasteatoda tepidariorum]XP_015914089.1 OTU domain-containing protein 5-B [Parasteatoda tepidariorum]
MTILPKKKNSQQKSETEKPADSVNHNYTNESHGHSAHPPESRERFNFTTRTSPPAWPLHSSREEKRPSHSPGQGFDEYGSSDSGPSHSKRRHQTSPHRSVRKARTHSNHSLRSAGSPLTYPPLAGPSQVQVSVQERQNNNVQGNASECQDDPSGYNSGDEYDRSLDNMTEEELLEKEKMFEERLGKKGYSIKKMGEDGACMFRAVADQIYGDQDMHAAVRKLCMDYMAKNSDYYSQYVTEDFEKYVQRKRSDHIHGNHIEMQAMSEMFNRHIEVYHYSSEPINIFHGSQKTDNEPIRLSYHRNVHYNSIVDPYKATIGVGLGLPSFKPDVMNKSLITDAIRASENLQLEQAMLEDKLRATDWEATNEAIEEQIARESYLEWLRDNEVKSRKKNGRTATATSSSSLMDCYSGSLSPQSNNRTHTKSRCSTSASSSPKISDCHAADKKSKTPEACHGGTSFDDALFGKKEVDGMAGSCASSSGNNEFMLDESASFLNELPPSVFGLSEWEESGILAKVLAESQQEYIDSLKRTSTN